MVYMNIEALSEYINLSKSTIYKKTMQNQIPYIKTGKKLLFKQESIDSWLNRNSFETVDVIRNNISQFLKPVAALG